jgi:hypothetical protein
MACVDLLQKQPEAIVLIPAWRRPEMLWHCLENIKLAAFADRMHYIFRFDQGHSPELHEVINGFPFSHEVAVTPRSHYLIAKQSYSVLTGYQLAASRPSASGRIYMIEEDVLIARDFFRWHAHMHAGPRPLFCSIGVRNPNRAVEQEGRHDEYYLSTLDYCSLGVCFHKAVFNQFVQPHIQPKYFVNPVEYCARHFPGCPIGRAFAEQDGLIRRIQWQQGEQLPIGYSYTGKAYHAGFYGYNRGAGPMGSLAYRIGYVADVIYSDAAMRSFAKHPEWYQDSKPIDLQDLPWNELKHKPLDLQANPVRV